LNDFISEIDQHPISIDDITTAEVLANTNTTSICQLECFMTELDKLLQTKSLYEDNQIDKHKIESKYETAKRTKSIRTRNVKGIYRRTHTESNIDKAKKKLPPKDSNISGKLLTNEGTMLLIKPEIACKGGFVLLPKLQTSATVVTNTSQTSGKLPILPITRSSSKSIVFKPRLLLPKK